MQASNKFVQILFVFMFYIKSSFSVKVLLYPPTKTMCPVCDNKYNYYLFITGSLKWRMLNRMWISPRSLYQWERPLYLILYGNLHISVLVYLDVFFQHKIDHSLSGQISWSANSIELGQIAQMCRLAWLFKYGWQGLITFGSSRIKTNYGQFQK